jgi:predicted transcriptional regulator
MAVKKAKEKAQPKAEEELRRELSDFVVMSPDLDGVDVRVFFYLASRLNFRDPVHVPQIELAVTLNKQQTHISRSLRTLVAAGVLVPGPDGTRASKWMLNPDYGT